VRRRGGGRGPGRAGAKPPPRARRGDGPPLRDPPRAARAPQDHDNCCPTCLEPYDGENPAIVASCGHAFHLPCIYEWLERSRTCPVCSRAMDFEELVYDDDFEDD